MKFFRVAVDDWLQGTIQLSLVDQGAYHRFLCVSWSRDGLTPDDDALISRLMGIDIRAWRSSKKRLLKAGKLVVDDGILLNNRARSEQRSVRSNSEVADISATDRWDLARDRAEKPNENNAPKSTNRKPLADSRKRKDIEKKKSPSRKTPIPGSWIDREISGLQFAAAIDRNFDGPVLYREWSKFTNYAVQHDKRYANWHRAWLSWMAKVEDFAPRKRNSDAMKEALDNMMRKAHESDASDRTGGPTDCILSDGERIPPGGVLRISEGGTSAVPVRDRPAGNSGRDAKVQIPRDSGGSD